MKICRTYAVDKQAKKIINSSVFSSLPLPNGIKPKTAFTLAEVLLTLAVVGVVAAMTIPGIIQSTNDTELRTSWKKAYAGLSSATQQILMAKGGSIKGLLTDDKSFKDLYLPYFNYTKSCDSGVRSICWATKDSWLDGSSKWAGWDEPDAGFISNDGMFFTFYKWGGDCTFLDTTYTAIPGCGRIEIDVNGFKGPNKYGKDIFLVFISKDSIKPGGAPNVFENRCAGSVGDWSGAGCGSIYLQN